MAQITINGISLDPVDYAKAGLLSADAAASNYILVQSPAPLTADQKKELESAGVAIHQYVSTNTYLCAYPHSDLAKLRKLTFVAWAEVYLKGFKLPPELRPRGAATEAWIMPPIPAPAMSNTVRKVDVVLHEDVDSSSADLKKRIAAARASQPGRHANEPA